MKNLKHIFFTVSMTALWGGAAQAQNAQDPAGVPRWPEFASDPANVMLLAVVALLLIVIFVLVGILRNTVKTVAPATEPEVTTNTPQGSVSGIEGEAVSADSGTFLRGLTDAVPLEDEDRVMLDHEYDGIRELDNNLPPWWVWMFWGTIVFSVIYLLWFEVLPYSKSQTQEYQAELKQAEVDRQAYLATQARPVDENTVTLLTDAADLKAGKEIYVANCQACHAPDGGGGVGPNFADKYWLHGGSIKDIFKVIKYGVPEKGMISWQSLLRPEEIAQVAGYVHSLGGTEPMSPKEPQGELWSPDADESGGAATDTTQGATPDIPSAGEGE